MFSIDYAVGNIDILGRLELYRTEVTRRLDQERRSTLGQFITPAPVARLMSSMLSLPAKDKVTLLDPGAGIGTLFAAFVETLCEKDIPPKEIVVVAYEVEPLFIEYLEDTAKICRRFCENRGIKFSANILQIDFIASAVSILNRDLFPPPLQQFTHAILNPPYHKIKANSSARKILRNCGIETGNLYTAFLSLTSMLLVDKGQMISITPRSFCNGPYFRTFRKQFLSIMNIERLHLFHSRKEAFREDSVLQENIIMSARKGSSPLATVTISSSTSANDEMINIRDLERSEVIYPNDNEAFIHIVTDELESRIAKLVRRFVSTLEDLGLGVSTGRVVDFRAKKYILTKPKQGTVPLIYPSNFVRGYVQWPLKGTKKSEAIMLTPETSGLLVPSGNYVLLKRFSSTEEKKRIVAVVFDSSRIQAMRVGFENHINYFHSNHAGLDPTVAKGLAAYLNSSFVDMYFRHFSGHTQVNAVDLRSLRYPTKQELEALGNYIGQEFPDQEELDRIIEKELFKMSETDTNNSPLSAKTKINEALSVLDIVGLPRAQQNERSALTLLALLDLEPSSNWVEARAPLCGITPMMGFFSEHYGKNYKPNTRETVRRQTVHQFLAAGLIVENPDEPTRPINSPKAVYQIEQGALELLRTFKTKDWNRNLKTYLSSRRTLVQRYSQERKMERVPIQIGEDKTILLSPGGQNILVEQVIKEFAPRFTPGADLIYVGDTDEKFAYFKGDLLKKLGVHLDPHGKMPDLIIYFKQKNWLVLVEAVTSHGPIDFKRHDELKQLFSKSSAGIVFVTAFLTRKAMAEYLNDISWETEVWVAEAPSHIIHFNGERFLGPY